MVGPIELPMPTFAVALPFLNEMVALFTVSVVIAYISYRFRLVPIVGFLIAGVVIGPSALGLVQNQELVDILAEIGVILLLFTIGMEFSLAKLSKIGRSIFLGGGMQVGASILLVVGVMVAFGLDVKAGIYTGCLVALSSTAIVLGLLSERDETDTPSGRLSLAILIFQDLAIIFMVLIIPILAGDGTSGAEIAVILGKAIGLIVAILLLARKIVPWILAIVARTGRQELFLLTVVAICFGTAAASSMAGVSLALGAFLAGLVVSESEYSDHAISEILPLRTIFNAVFFVSVGMLLDVSFLADHLLIVLAAAVAVIVVKTLITMGSVLVLGFPVRIAAATGFALAQIGEFSFVLERAGRLEGLSPAGLGEPGAQTFIAATVLLMLLTPFQMQFSHRFGALVARLPLPGRRDREEADPIDEQRVDHIEDHVVVVGYGAAGRRLVQVLQDRQIPFIVVEMNPLSVQELQKQEIRTIYGDASRIHILEAAHISEAKLCVLIINEATIAPAIIRTARYLNPTLQIIARTRYLESMESLQQAGADIVVPEEMETTVRIFSHVLGAYMIPREEVERQIQIIRAQDYGIMRGSIQEAHLMVLQGLDEDGMHTRAVAVREGTRADGKTLEELALRRDHALTVLAVRRDGHTISSPAGDFRVCAGDRLVMVGTADKFAHCADLFRKDAPPAELTTEPR